MKIKSIILLLTILGYCEFSAAENTITLTQLQVDNLGIKSGKLKGTKQVPFLYAPASVVVPPEQEFIVSASLAGLLSKLTVAVGDSVSKGQLLAQINSPDLLVLQRQFLKAASQRSLAWSSYQRDKKLFEEGVIAERRWLETNTRYHSFHSETNEARQLLEIAGMSSEAINNLQKTRRLSSQLDAYAPIAGVVLEKMAIAGERVDILAPLYRIANLEQLWLEINIPQEKMANINSGDQVLIANSSATARISLLAQTVNPVSQTILARAIITDPRRQVRAGQSVNTQIIQQHSSPAFRVSNNAIAQRDGQAYLFIRTPGGYKAQAVDILGKEGQHSVITGKLQAGTEYAVSGGMVLKAKWLGLGEGGDE